MKRNFLIASLALFGLTIGLGACASTDKGQGDPSTDPLHGGDDSYKGNEPSKKKGWKGHPLHISANMGTYTLLTTRKSGRDLHPFVHVHAESQKSDLYFSSDNDGRGYDIYLKHPGGASLRKITSLAGNEYWPTVSSDGRWLAFGSDRKGNLDIYVMDLRNQSAPPFNVTQGHTQNDIQPAWSNDGTQLVYASYSPTHGDFVLKYVTFGVSTSMASRNTGASTLAFGDVEGSLPTNSDKDETMANTSISSLSIRDRGTLTTNQGTTITGMHPHFRPNTNQRHVVYQDYARAGKGWNAIKVFDMSQGSITQIPVSEDYGAIQPRWSPDGKRIVFATVAKTTQQGDHAPVGADGFGITDMAGAGVADLRNPTDREQVSNPIWVREKGEDVLYFSASSNDAEVLASVKLTSR